VTRFVFPRLAHAHAEPLLEEYRRAYRRDGLDALWEAAGTEHPHASPVPTGGAVAPRDHLRRIRNCVLEAVRPWYETGEVPRREVAEFDIALGRALHGVLEIIPSDAAHMETWNFLSLVLMPDVGVLRYPEMHSDRLLGGPRNALRSTWIRRDTLGELLDIPRRGLGVDELVGLFERSDMARNRPLVRALANAIINTKYTGPRSAWARKLSKEVRYLTGPLLLDGMGEEQLSRLVAETEMRLLAEEP